MARSVQISKTSKSKVVLFKKEGYKNKEIASSLGLSEASVCRILKRNKENVTCPDEKKWLASENDTMDGPKNP